MSGHLRMSKKERIRESVFEEVLSGRCLLKVAAARLGLSERQCRRSYKRFRAEGAAGLVHRSRDRPSNRGHPASFKARVVKRYEERYEPRKFGPTLASEKLAEEGLEVHPETLRRWLLADGHAPWRRRRRKHRERRERREHFGELVQMDGSHHQWFGSQRPKACLMNMVDDACGTTMSAMSEEETTEAAMRSLWHWIERYGIPQALYTDRKTVFITDREPTLEEQLAGEEPKTAFGKACAKLGIEIIPANSPQAKGRVERNHGVYQDRLVKEMALRGITTIAGANKLLHNGFTAELNAKFEREPAKPEDYHRPVPKGLDLADVFSFEEPRTVQNDWTVRYKNRHYQILGENKPLPKPKEKVLVRLRLDGTLQLIYRDKPLAYRTISVKELRARAAPKTPPAKPKTKTNKPTTSTPHRSPWRQNCIHMFAETKKKK